MAALPGGWTVACGWCWGGVGRLPRLAIQWSRDLGAGMLAGWRKWRSVLRSTLGCMSLCRRLTVGWGLGLRLMACRVWGMLWRLWGCRWLRLGSWWLMGGLWGLGMCR